VEATMTRVFTYEQSIEHAGKLACNQIRRALKKSAVSAMTKKGLMRALPGIKSAVGAAMSLSPSPLPFVLANGREDWLATNVPMEPPVNEEERARKMAHDGARATVWSIIEEAIHRRDPTNALIYVRVLLGPEGWQRLIGDQQNISNRGRASIAWAIAFRTGDGDMAGGALGVLEL
jgi:hypothetical protein